MDYLDKLIQLAQITGKINVQCRFHGNWQVLHAQEPNLLGVFHIIAKGECHLYVGEQHFHLKAGDIFFLPQGAAHRLESTSAHGDRTPMVTEVYPHLILKRNNQVDYDFEMFCGHFYANGNLSPLFQLPEYWLLSPPTTVSCALLHLLQYETGENLGGQSTINGLCQVLLTYLVRDYLQKNSNHGMLAALQDKRLYPAVNAMLLNPEKAWNMENLAALCAMSRANFIRLFKQKTDYLPGRFLTDLRMQKAQLLLKNSTQSVFSIAQDVGYQSEAYFSKTFKTYYGVSPAKFRTGI